MRIMRSKLKILGLAIFLIIAMASCSKGGRATPADAFEYRTRTGENGPGVAITGIKDATITKVRIPNKIGDLPVISVSGMDKNSLVYISVPSSVESLDLSGCKNLTTVEFAKGSNLEYICLRDCVSLASINIPESVVKISNDAFRGCVGFKSIEIKDTVKEIGDSAFRGCSNIESFNLPDSVVSIGNSAFSACSSLKSIDLPNGLKNIGSDAFNGCSSLENVIIPFNISVISDSIFKNCFSLKTVAAQSQSIVSVGNEAFSGCINLATISFPLDSLTSIGYSAFEDCRQLKNFAIGRFVKSIGRSAFKNCISLENVAMSNRQITEFPNNIFDGCVKLKDVGIPISVTRIGSEAFRNCVSLEFIVIPPSIKDIGSNAFVDFSGEVSFFDGTKVIPSEALKNASKVTNVVLPSTVEEIKSHAFDNCVSLKSITIPASVKRTGYGGVLEKSEGILDNCSCEVIFAEGMKCIPNHALTDLSEESKVVIPLTVKEFARFSLERFGGKNIYFAGTKQQWKSIELPVRDWWWESHFVVHCSDGDITY